MSTPIRNGTQPIHLANNMEVNRNTLVRTNQVAPIIIKNCTEEYQHVTNFKGPLVYGRIAEGMPEHALVQSQYFLVKDVCVQMDQLETLPQYMAPNMRQAWGGFPIYGLGQPTLNGLTTLIHVLREEQFEDILLFNLRAEPVLFVRLDHDMVPYSVRHQDNLRECISTPNWHLEDLSNIEVKLRKEVIDHALLREDNTFYFYHDLMTFKDEPHMFKVAYEDDLAVTDEIYSRLSFNNSGTKYTRLMIPPVGAPLGRELDTFIEAFKGIPSFFDRGTGPSPALVFTAHAGLSRTTFGMVLGCLVLSHKTGFPNEATKAPYQINKKSPNFERGEFHVIQELVSVLPNGLRTKQQVDIAIDRCDELHNVRSFANESRRCLETITDDYFIEGVSACTFIARQCRKHVEQYAFLLVFGAYLGCQYPRLFSTSFTQWMQQCPELYHILRYIDISERGTSPSLLTDGLRVLVADEYIGLDVISSQIDVKTSNFRRVSGLCVYGMAQPSRAGLACVVTHLLSPKQRHPVVVIVNLREDLVVECHGTTYSWRETCDLQEPIIMPGIPVADIEEKEEQMKKEIKKKKVFQVYHEIDRRAEQREFQSVLTPVDMCNQLRLQVPELRYHRIPISDDKAPTEENFDTLMRLALSFEELDTDEDGPAIVFHCRTGKGRTTTAMAITGLVICHRKGFPYGTKPGEEERVSLPNADYTKGNFQVVHRLVRRIPEGQQVKREVDFILDMCSDTMTPMHYHIREVIFVTYNKIRKAKNDEERESYRMRTFDYLERYIYLILFNAYLHCERRHKWKMTFVAWMKNVACKVGVYDILDNLSFPELDNSAITSTRRQRWEYNSSKLPYRGSFI